MANSSRSSNDQRSDSKNPTSQEYKDSMDNHSQQLDPQNDKFAGGQQQQEQPQQGRQQDK